MIYPSSLNLRRLIFLGVLSVSLAYIFGSEGFESFVSAYLLAGILFSYYLWKFATIIMDSKTWLILRILGVIILVPIWLVFIMTVLVPVLNEEFMPKIYSSTNWVIVVFVLLSYLFSRLVSPPSEHNYEQIIIGLITLLLSIVLMYLGLLTFARSETLLQQIVLVIVVQLQLLMSYIYLNTNYLKRMHEITNQFIIRKNLTRTDREVYIYLGVLGAPFLIPVVILMVIS